VTPARSTAPLGAREDHRIGRGLADDLLQQASAGDRRAQPLAQFGQQETTQVGLPLHELLRQAREHGQRACPIEAAQGNVVLRVNGFSPVVGMHLGEDDIRTFRHVQTEASAVLHCFRRVGNGLLPFEPDRGVALADGGGERSELFV
jgi:hypothetical protein